MWIYIVAGERNTKPGAVSDSGGLWANVGQTDRLPEIRLLDEDYRRKAAGGTWLILAEFDIGNSSLTDKDIHKYLKQHSEVRWEPSYNTEEFLFTSDDGTGEAAKQIIHEFLQDKCLNLLQAAYAELQEKCLDLEAEKCEVETSFARYMETDEGRMKEEYFFNLSRMRETLEDTKQKMNASFNKKLADSLAELNSDFTSRKALLTRERESLTCERQTVEQGKRQLESERLQLKMSQEEHQKQLEIRTEEMRLALRTQVTQEWAKLNQAKEQFANDKLNSFNKLDHENDKLRTSVENRTQALWGLAVYGFLATFVSCAISKDQANTHNYALELQGKLIQAEKKLEASNQALEEKDKVIESFGKASADKEQAVLPAIEVQELNNKVQPSLNDKPKDIQVVKAIELSRVPSQVIQNPKAVDLGPIAIAEEESGNQISEEEQKRINNSVMWNKIRDCENSCNQQKVSCQQAETNPHYSCAVINDRIVCSHSCKAVMEKDCAANCLSQHWLLD